MNSDNSLNMASEERSRKVKDSKAKEMKQEFEQFVQNIKLASRNIESFSQSMMDSLKLKYQAIYEIEQLACVFDALSRKISGKQCMNWTELETKYLVSLVAYYCNFSGKDYRSLIENDWQILTKIFPTKRANKIQNRWRTILIEALDSTDRKSKTCQLKQINNKNEWSSEEDLKLMTAFLAAGKEWSTIAKRLGNRTETEINTRWTILMRTLVAQNKNLSGNLSQNDEAFQTQCVREYVERANARSLPFKQTSSEYDSATTTAESICEDDVAQSNLFSYQRVPLVMNMPQMIFPTYQKYLTNGLQYVPNVYFNNQWILPMCYSTFPILNNTPRCFSVSGQAGIQASGLNTTHLFKFSSGNTAREEFSKEVTKADSKVFFAKVNMQNSQIQLIERVSESTFPKFFQK